MADIGLFDQVYNPDVLSCLANLSNDEVFTPPEVANAMLDMLPQELFRNPDTKFLDPACKSGVFLREIAKRLIAGLERQFPDLQDRIDHIFFRSTYLIDIAAEIRQTAAKIPVFFRRQKVSVHVIGMQERKLLLRHDGCPLLCTFIMP